MIFDLGVKSMSQARGKTGGVERVAVQASARSRNLPSILSDFRLFDAQKREERARELVELTSRLVRIPSVSGDKNVELDKENEVAKEIVAWLNDVPGVKARVVKIEGDFRDRVFAFGFLKGSGEKTLALTGHFDTVGFNSSEEERQLLTPEVKGDYLHGRGAHDMKGGVAVQMVALKELASKRGQLNGNIAFIAVPDEENNSAGIMAAMKFFEEFMAKEGLRCVGVVNSDYTAPLYEGDDSRYVYTGTIGKLLPTVLVRGVETHVGEVFNGLSAVSVLAQLTRMVELNAEFCDESHGEMTPPPSALAHKDLKPFYNVQTPLDAVAYYNFFTLSLSPGSVLEKFRQAAMQAFKIVLRDFARARSKYVSSIGFPGVESRWQPRVATFEELLSEMRARNPRVESEVREEVVRDVARGVVSGDVRDVSVAFALKLVSKLDCGQPLALLLFSPPFYPAIPPMQEDSAFMHAVDASVEVFNARKEDKPLRKRAFYPYISDMSYIVRPPGLDANLRAFVSNAPAYGQHYSVSMPSFSAPIANIGPFGHDAHKPGERAFIPYSFKLLPEVLLEVIARTLEK